MDVVVVWPSNKAETEDVDQLISLSACDSVEFSLNLLPVNLHILSL